MKLKMIDEEIMVVIFLVDENDELFKDMVEQVFRNYVEIFRFKMSYYFFRRIGLIKNILQLKFDQF